jgi:hypothetical protein
MGLRATGSPIHEHYIDVLIARLQQAGVTQVHSEPVPVQRWTAGTWSLESAERSSEPIATSSYIPYSGSTPAGGVTGPLARVGSAGSVNYKYTLPLTAGRALAADAGSGIA